MSTSSFRLITSIAILGACASATSTAAPSDASAATDTMPAPDTPAAPPACITGRIATLASAPVGLPPASVYRCTYQGAAVFYLPPQCCDQYSVLLSSDCTTICAPDGGFTGRGDGRCADFQQATCTLLWQDSRTR